MPSKRLRLSDVTLDRRSNKAAWALRKLRHTLAKNQLNFFSDENNFSQDQKANKKNDHWLCSDSKDVPTRVSLKCLAFVMVLGVICNKDNITGLFFFEDDLKDFANACIHVMDTAVKLWIQRTAGDHRHVF